MARVRAGLTVFRKPRLGAIAGGAQLGAWGLQWLSCYLIAAAVVVQGAAGGSPGVARLQVDGGRELPAADDGVENPVTRIERLALTERQSIGRGEDSAMRNIGRRNAAIVLKSSPQPGTKTLDWRGSDRMKVMRCAGR